MTQRVRIIEGEMTGGETATLIGLASEIDPANIEAYVLVVFKHKSANHHEVILTSSHASQPEQVMRLLNMGRITVDKIMGRTDAQTTDASTLRTSMRTFRIPGYRRWRRRRTPLQMGSVRVGVHYGGASPSPVDMPPRL